MLQGIRLCMVDSYVEASLRKSLAECSQHVEVKCCFVWYAVMSAHILLSERHLPLCGMGVYTGGVRKFGHVIM